MIFVAVPLQLLPGPFDGDDADFVRTCFNREDEEPCTRCGTCEDCYYACSEDEYDNEN